LQLNGRGINLQRSSVEVLPIWAEAVGSVNDLLNIIFFPDVAIYDQAWAQGTMNFRSTNLWDGVTATAPNHTVTTALGAVGVPRGFSFVPTLADSFTNAEDHFPVIVTNF